jgi:hypothetical protein
MADGEKLLLMYLSKQKTPQIVLEIASLSDASFGLASVRDENAWLILDLLSTP